LNLYLGEGEWTATAETKQHPGVKGFAHEPASPDAIFHIEVKVSAILDITAPSVLSALNTSPDELMANWRTQSPKAPTQLLGNAIFESKRFEGVRYQSAPMKKSGVEGYCLLLFRERKQASSTVRIFDPTGVWSESW
jgi:RES domain-containing protein